MDNSMAAIISLKLQGTQDTEWVYTGKKFLTRIFSHSQRKSLILIMRDANIDFVIGLHQRLSYRIYVIFDALENTVSDINSVLWKFFEFTSSI